MAKDKNEVRYDADGARRVMHAGDYMADFSGQLALGLMGNIVGQMTYFYTDKVGLAVGGVGIVMAIAKFIDAFTDVIFGNIVDHSKGGNKKYYQWMLRMSVPAAVIMILMFTVPIQAGQIPALAYVLITNLLLTAVIYTMIATPFSAVMVVRTNSQSERGSMGVFRAVGNYGAGMIISIATIPVTNILGGTQSAWIKYGAVLALAVLLLFLVCYNNGRKAVFVSDLESADTAANAEEEEAVPFKDAMGMLLKNKYWVIVLLFNLITAVTNAITGSSGAYYCKWIFGNDGLVGLLGAVGMLATAAGFVLSKLIIAKLGVTRTINVGLLGAAVTAAVRSLIPTNFNVYMVTGLLGSFIQIPLMCLYGVLLAMTVDYNEWKYEKTLVATASGAIGFGNKVGNGLGSLLLSLFLVLGSYDATLPAATSSMRISIYGFSNYLPVVINLLMFIIFRKFDLEKKLPGIKGKKGQMVTIRHAEVLDRDGVFYPDTLRTAVSTDTYILNGKEQVLMPHFTFHGFRYIAVEGIRTLKPEMFTACAMHSDMKKTGYFHCSNPAVNQLQSNIEWGLRDNFFDIPSDCPQRDERLGWMGDAQVFSWTAAFNRNTALFFSKWMKDVAAASSLEKGVPHIVPDIQGTYSSAGWSDAAVIIPWVVYQTYGDVRILEESWQCMHEWVDYIHNRVNEDGLWMTNYQYGDWLALDREQGDKSVGATDVYLVANAYYLYVTGLVAQTARVLGKEKDAEYYMELYAKTLESFREEYYTLRGRIVSETQTGCVLSLHFGLAREKDREKILHKLLANIEDHKNHLTTGFLGTPYLCHALSDNGAHDKASVLFMRDDYPSWLYAVKMGATTIWERWDAIMPDGTMHHPGLNSMNHYAYGSIGDWIYRKIGGINQLEAGYHRFYVKPMFVHGIEEARTELETPYGKIVSAWSCKNKKIHVEVQIPANTSAVIYLPEKEDSLNVGSGIYVYEYETKTSLKELRFSLDNTLGEVMEEPLGKQMLDQMAPELMANPMIAYAKQMTLAEGISSAPEIRAVFEAVVQALNEQDA